MQVHIELPRVQHASKEDKRRFYYAICEFGTSYAKLVSFMVLFYKYSELQSYCLLDSKQ